MLSPPPTPSEFTTLIHGAVADEAPRLFAVVEELDDRTDARIAAWGMAFEDRAEIIRTDGPLRMSLSSPESALNLYANNPRVHPHLIWVDPTLTTPE
ncbi:hypothetical protein [Actinokineospora enzanensis]|uniref:hypothetical protein n=1 Tax=Actinokineospora enzanensis TaxID=155975 RepID=UPI00035D3FBC|nr:hypothetical protein [Actinokineospora enzanensis]